MGGKEEEAEGEGRGIDLGGKGRDAFADEFENGGYSGIVVILFEEAKLHSSRMISVPRMLLWWA